MFSWELSPEDALRVEASGSPGLGGPWASSIMRRASESGDDYVQYTEWSAGPLAKGRTASDSIRGGRARAAPPGALGGAPLRRIVPRVVARPCGAAPLPLFTSAGSCDLG